MNPIKTGPDSLSTLPASLTAAPANESGNATLPAFPTSRRNFLKTGGILGAGLVLGAPAILRASTAAAPSDAINVAFIGLGKQHEVLFSAMRNIPGLRYKAVCDIMNNRVGSGYSRIRSTTGEEPARYVDAEEMFSKEKDLDAVIITTPDFWHAPHTIMSLEAGCHVYCEKMMAESLESARSMVAATDRTGKLCQIGHQRRSNPRYLFTLEQLINGNRICGHIVNINGQWNRAIAASQDIQVKESILPKADVLQRFGYENTHQFLNWRWYKRLSGGPISDLGAHQIDIYNWFLGATPKSLVASGGRNHFKDREHFDNVMCIFEYDTPEGGCRAFYQVLTTTSAGGGYFESFMGTDATIHISERAAFTSIYRESTAPPWDDLVSRGVLRRAAAAAPAGGDDADSIASYESAAPEKFDLPGSMNKPPHQPHLENFFGAIRGKEKLNCDARHALESEAPIYWVNPAAEQQTMIHFTEDHLRVV